MLFPCHERDKHSSICECDVMNLKDEIESIDGSLSRLIATYFIVFGVGLRRGEKVIFLRMLAFP